CPECLLLVAYLYPDTPNATHGRSFSLKIAHQSTPYHGLDHSTTPAVPPFRISM
ncbi:hypothetical protein SARC_13664, partial [Sphaeroforma arctica JP610]